MGVSYKEFSLQVYGRGWSVNCVASGASPRTPRVHVDYWVQLARIEEGKAAARVTGRPVTPARRLNDG